jgi:hypothetical protein
MAIKTREGLHEAPHTIDGVYVRDMEEPIDYRGETWVRLTARDGRAWEFSLTTGRLLPVLPVGR